MGTTRALWLLYASPQSVEYAHELRGKFGLDVRLLLQVEIPPASALTSGVGKSIDLKPTLAEIALLELLVIGSPPKEMAKTLGISRRAVRLRSSSLRKKLRASSNAAMVAQAMRQGLVK